jgi:hypothetical protein
VVVDTFYNKAYACCSFGWQEIDFTVTFKAKGYDNAEMRFYILLRDECGDTFGVTMYAESLNDCLDLLAEEYPESSVVDVNMIIMGS